MTTLLEPTVSLELDHSLEHGQPLEPSVEPVKALEAFEETAFGIGATLCRDAVWDGERCNWLGSSMEPVAGRWQVVQRSFGPDFYSGTGGIAYFLAHLYRQSGDAVIAKTASGALRAAYSRLDLLQASGQIGFYTGLTGLAYVAFALGETLDDQEWLRRGRKLLDQVLEIDPAGQGLDVLAGVAGAIPALISLRALHPEALPRAVYLGDHLCQAAEQRDIGWSWDTLGGENLAEDHLTGFSHGSCGIAWSLLELAEASREKRFRNAADEGFRYSRHWFDLEAENWPDLRDMASHGVSASGPQQTQGSRIFPVQWCHGAPGAGLARLRAYELTGDITQRDEAEAAIRTTARDLQAGTGQTNFSLCHGMPGNAELLQLGARVLEQPDYLRAARAIGSVGIRRYGQEGHDWPSGVQGGAAAPGLMLGAAGTGYFFLRLAVPDLPSVLLLPVD